MNDPLFPPAPLPAIRIERLMMCACRAFPHDVIIQFGGNNLLVYGENGSGKSSIFYALRHFFSLNPPPISAVSNVRNPNAANDFRVAVEFVGDAAVAAWTPAGHPARAWPASDARVTEAALRKACLDYRSLLDTNYLHGDERPNLFTVAVEHLLADYPVTLAGSTKTIAQLWQAVQAARPKTWTASHDRINEACAEFNIGFRSALDAVLPQMQALLAGIPNLSVTLAPFDFSGVTYEGNFYTEKRKIAGQTLYPEIAFDGYQPPKPQGFLNEARLSAIALAMYLGGRLASVPTNGAGKLKLLVLDDVLIGLDHDNRQPILALLRDHFADWQVVLLTHDRVWFDMTRAFFHASGDWTWAEISADGNNGTATPTIRQNNLDVVEAALVEADSLRNAHLSAATNSARRATEMALQIFAEKRRIKLPFKRDVRDVGPYMLLDKIDEWIAEQVARGPLAPVSADIRAFLNAAGNPQSHANAPNPSSQDVQTAIAAVRALRQSQVQ
jgi:AAA domain